jgi:D-xylose transport system ATP-binding protein
MTTAASAPKPLLEMRGIGKSFSGVRALDGVSFELNAGEIHALVGENGAGKTTLMKILGGAHSVNTYEGTIVINGGVKRFHSVRDSERAGIAIVFPEFSLIPELTVGENIFLGRAPGPWGIIQWDALYARAAKLLDELAVDLDPRIQVGRLGTRRQQLVEIAKAYSQNAAMLILDKPTAALTDAEAESLFELLEQLRAQAWRTVLSGRKHGLAPWIGAGVVIRILVPSAR